MSEHDFEFQYDAEAATKADNRASRIDTSGKYIGKLTSAHKIVAKSKTVGVQFVFDCPDGSAEFNLYHTKEDGSKTFGYEQIQALLGVLGLRGLRAAAGTARQYNESTNAWDDTMQATVYPDLVGKPVGVVLRKRLYDGKKGDAYSFDLEHVFDAQTGQTGSEKRTNKPAEKVAKALKSLADKDERKSKAVGVVGGIDDVVF